MTEDILRQMVSTLGKLPGPWWQAWEEREHYFEEDGTPKKQSTGGRFPTNLYPLRRQIEDIGRDDPPGEIDVDADASESQRKGLKPQEMDRLEDLLRNMLKYEPGARITVATALKSAWFQCTRSPAPKIPKVERRGDVPPPSSVLWRSPGDSPTKTLAGVAEWGC